MLMEIRNYDSYTKLLNVIPVTLIRNVRITTVTKNYSL